MHANQLSSGLIDSRQSKSTFECEINPIGKSGFQFSNRFSLRLASSN